MTQGRKDTVWGARRGIVLETVQYCVGSPGKSLRTAAADERVELNDVDEEQNAALSVRPSGLLSFMSSFKLRNAGAYPGRRRVTPP